MGGQYSTEQIPDLSGKIAIVTGASAGIGKVTALELARKGFHYFWVLRRLQSLSRWTIS